MNTIKDAYYKFIADVGESPHENKIYEKACFYSGAVAVLGMIFHQMQTGVSEEAKIALLVSWLKECENFPDSISVKEVESKHLQ